MSGIVTGALLRFVLALPGLQGAAPICAFDLEVICPHEDQRRPNISPGRMAQKAAIATMSRSRMPCHSPNLPWRIQLSTRRTANSVSASSFHRKDR
jgi:hypothetical protein